MKSKSGFSILGAIGLATLLAASAVAIVQFQKVIDNETHLAAVNHSVALAEDIVRTQIAIQTQELTQRAQVLSFVNRFDPTGKLPEETFKVPINNSMCANNLPCNIEVLEFFREGLVTSPDYPTGIRITLGVMPTNQNFLKVKINPTTLSFSIPTQAALNQNKSVSQLLCPISMPIFKGTRINAYNVMEPICQALNPANNARAEIQGLSLRIICNGDKWLSEVSDGLLPLCKEFPDGLREPVSAKVCPDGLVAKQFSFSNSLQVQDPKCVERGGPYEFVQSIRSWDQ